MKRDDFGMRIDEVRELATKYSKPELARMVQMGLIPPQQALMAGMMIDRIAKSAMQPPTTTVAEDVLAPQPTSAQSGIMAAPGAPAPSGGVATLPSGLQNMAGGGIVAFADGGETDDVPGFAGGRLIDAEALMPGVIAAESRGDPNAVSRRGARGLAQLMPSTARRPGYGVRPAKDESQEENVRVGRDYLDAMLKKYGNVEHALAAYNWGPGNVDKWIARGAKPEELPAETREYIPRVKASLAAQDKKPASAGLRALVTPLESLISSAQAAEKPTMSRAPAKPAAAPDYMYQDPFGAPDYTTEGFSLKQPVTPGKPYEPSLQGAIFGYEHVPEQSRAPATAPAPKKPAAPTTFEPKTEAPAPEAPAPSAPSVPTLTPSRIPVPAEKTIRESVAEQEEADRLLGVDRNVFENMRKEYKEMGGKLSERKDRAAGMALMMFGAGLAGARRGQEWQTAGAAAQQALSGFMSAMDRISDNEDKLADKMRDLELAKQQYLRTKSDRALADIRQNKQEIRAINVDNAKLENTTAIEGAKLAVEDIKTRNPAQWVTIQNIAKESGMKPMDVYLMSLGMTKTGQMTFNQALEAVQRNMKTSGLSIEEQMEKARKLVKDTGGGGGGGLPAPKSADELAKLPKGTTYQAPDGSTRVKQ